jgi:hypothetical protein
MTTRSGYVRHIEKGITSSEIPWISLYSLSAVAPNEEIPDERPNPE